MSGSKPHRDAEFWQHAFERADLGVWDWDLVTGSCYYSPGWARMLGYREGELPPADDLWIRLAHPDDRERAIHSGDRHIAGLTAGIETELRLRHKDGHWIWVLDRGGIVERDGNGRPTRVVGVQTNITRQKQAEVELESVNERFRLALTAGGIGIWHHDFAAGRSIWDARTREIFGLPAVDQELPSETWHLHLHPDDREQAEAAHLVPVESHKASKIRYRIIRADGEVRHVESLAKFVPSPPPSGMLVGTIRDVTDDVRAAELLQVEKERLRVTLRSISDAVLSADVDGRVRFVNAGACALLRRDERDLVGMEAAEALAPVLRLQQGFGAGSAHGPAPCADEAVAVRLTESPIRSCEGETIGTVYTMQDVTADLRRQRELAHAARHDALTGLLNRAAFEDIVSAALREAEREPVAVFYIDLDYFKALNDFAGHAAGDAALKSIAAGLRTALPATAAAARLGGDEFAAVMTGCAEADAAAMGEAMLEAIRAADIGAGSAAQKLAASIGAAVIRDSAVSVADALACADDACYAAKAAGRNQYSLHAAQAGPSLSGLNAARLASDTVDAMEDGRLLIYGQQIRPLEHAFENSAYVEVLARLFSHHGDPIDPGRFIPAAERFGVAGALDRWMLRTALRRYAPLMREGRGTTLAFNLSAQTLSDPTLWDFVDRVIEDTGAAYGGIVFEITETTAVTSFAAASRFVAQARERRCKVSLDDFGAGLSSFEYLRRFPIDIIKINGSFVQNVRDSRFDKEIVKAIVSLAGGLNYTVVAEKVDSAETVETLRAMGVQFGQGFLLHRPEPLGRALGAGETAGVARAG